MAGRPATGVLSGTRLSGRSILTALCLPTIKSPPYPKLNEHNMKNALTANLTMLLLVLIVGIVFLSDMGNAAACCYVGCPPDKPNCRAW